MLTAILPICIKQNPFWSSSKGLRCIDDFLGVCRQIPEIKKFIVITQDDAVCSIAKKHNMEINKTFIPDCNNQPYTFEQTRILAINFEKHCKKSTDGLLLLDHRNLFLTADDITKAIILYQQNPQVGVISLAFCWDYPCQYKSFYSFLDCVIFHFDKTATKDGCPAVTKEDLSADIICNIKAYGELTINISAKTPLYSISFYSKNLNLKDYVAQIIPFDINGPQYLQCQELYIPTPEYKQIFKIKPEESTGIIIVLTMPSKSGEYDTVEIFTPTNATWELSGIGSSMSDKKNHELMFGRQQFPLAYTYDGSLSVLGRKQLKKKSGINPISLILKKSCIINDLVDYFYFVTDQLTEETLRN